MAIFGKAGNRAGISSDAAWCFGFALIVMCKVAVAVQPAPQGSVLDPAFERIPLDRWLSERDHSHFRWGVKVWPTLLSYQQRLRARVSIQIDGRDVLERRGKGEFLLLAQLSDGSGRVYQSHHSIELQNVDDQMKSINMIWDLYAFVLPGKYLVSFAICHTASGEHSATQRTLQVGPLKGDFLTDAWRGIPAVEFLEIQDPPGGWYLPSLAGRLNLSIETHRPVHIDVMLNATASELTRVPPANISNQNLGVLIPLLKVLTQIKVPNGRLDAAMLDLATQRLSFEQRDIREFDWERLKAALTEANPNLIDAKALANRQKMAQFFVREVGRRIGATREPGNSPEPLRVLIVLSGPMAFAKGEDLRPIEMNASPNVRVYYVRCQARALRPMMLSRTGRGGSRRPGTGRTMPGLVTQPDQMDYLEGTIKPLKPRVFEVRTPQDFRKALGTMLDEISRM